MTLHGRPGEAAMTFDDVPQLRDLPVYEYYLAKAQEGIGSPEAKATYARFLAMLHDPAPTDPLTTAARKRTEAQ